MKHGSVKPECTEHVGDLYFQCPEPQKHTCLQDQEQTTLEGEKGTGKNGIGSPYSLVTHNDVLVQTVYSADRVCTD